MISPPVFLVWDDAQLTVLNAPKVLEKYLHYTHKVLEWNDEKHRRDVVRKKVELFNDVSNGPVRALQTMPGLLDMVQTLLDKHGIPWKLIDNRLPFPVPQWKRLCGFRFSQQALVEKLLQANRSGCLEAPTRFGKTTLLTNVLRAFPDLPTVVTAPGVDLVKQLHEELVEKLPDRKIAGLYTGSRKSKDSPDITVASMDSLHKCDLNGTRLLLIDEPHSAVTATRAPLISAFTQARRFGFGATLDGRFDDADILITGLIGPTLARRTYTEAVAEGAICPITVVMLRVPFMPLRTSHRDVAYRFLIWQNKELHALVGKICNEALPPDWQTLVFIENEKQAEGIFEHMPDGTIAMAKRMTAPERVDITERVKSGAIRRCIASDIYATGVTFHEVRALVNAAGGGGSISCIQKPGRLAEIRPNKKGGLVVDFVYESKLAESPVKKNDSDAWQALIADSWARCRVYKEKGYTVYIVESIDELRRQVASLI